jgi:two-component system sensor histidine kinase YesM
VEIADNGKGFPEGILPKLNANESIVNESGEHIGIWNVQRRLNLLYREYTQIEFKNKKPSGAVIVIMIPLEVNK